MRTDRQTHRLTDGSENTTPRSTTVGEWRRLSRLSSSAGDVTSIRNCRCDSSCRMSSSLSVQFVVTASDTGHLTIASFLLSSPPRSITVRQSGVWTPHSLASSIVHLLMATHVSQWHTAGATFDIGSTTLRDPACYRRHL